MSLFSKRYDKALNERVLRPSLPMRLRKRIWSMLQRFNYTYSYQPDPTDNWWDTTSLLDELPQKLKAEYGADHLLAYVDDSRERAPTDLEGLVLRGWPGHVLDVVEQVFADLPDDQKFDFQREINRVMGEEGSPWRLADGQFLQIDSEFLALELERAQDMLKTHGFAGAYDEFREARLDLTAGDYKGAIRNACNALESTMKVIIGADSGNASVPIRKLVEDGFFDELPETMQASFGEQVLMSLPTIGRHTEIARARTRHAHRTHAVAGRRLPASPGRRHPLLAAERGLNVCRTV